MRLSRLGIFSAAVALATAGLLPIGAGTAGAATTCSISEYPALPAGQSGLKVGCTVGAPSPSTLTYHDFAPATGTNAGAVWHSGAVRTVTAGHTTSGSPTISAATGAFVAAVDTNRSITGTGIPLGAFIKSVTNATTAVMSANATATSAAAVFKIENSTSRSVTNGKTTSGSGTVTSATANFQPGDVGKFVSGAGIKPGAKITARASTTSVTISPVADATAPLAGTQLSFESPVESSTSRFVNDAHTTSGSATITSATAVFDLVNDKGISVTGPGIPANTIISGVTSATQATLNHTATATSTAAQLIIGQPTVTAPVNGEQVLQISAELQLNPTLVAGSDSCSEGTPEGFVIPGKWENPGSFVTTGGVLGAPVSGAIAQLLVPTAVVSFAGYVVRLAGGKYDVRFPLVPTGIAACSGTTIGTTFTYDAVTVSQGSAPSGRGVPGTNQVRALRNFAPPTTSQATSASVVLGSTVTAGCTVTRQINAPTFACGQG